MTYTVPTVGTTGDLLVDAGRLGAYVRAGDVIAADLGEFDPNEIVLWLSLPDETPLLIRTGHDEADQAVLGEKIAQHLFAAAEGERYALCDHCEEPTPVSDLREVSYRGDLCPECVDNAEVLS